MREPPLLERKRRIPAGLYLGVDSDQRHAWLQGKVIRDRLDWFSCSFLQLGPEIIADGVLILVSLHVCPHALAERLLLDIVLEHADDRLSFFVGDPVELLVGIAARHGHDDGVCRALGVLPHRLLPRRLRLKPSHPLGMETIGGFVLHPGGKALVALEQERFEVGRLWVGPPAGLGRLDGGLRHQRPVEHR